MSNIKNIDKRLCIECGKTKPIKEFNKIHHGYHSKICKSCVNEKKLKKKYDNVLEEYLTSDSMHIKRQYKDIDAYRILRKKDSKIDFIAKDEKFVKLNYYRDTWGSNYGRVIVLEDGKYRLKRGNYDRYTGEKVYTLYKEEYIKSLRIFKYRKRKVTASELVIETFIVNHDKTNNTKVWHLNGDVKDNYYKHLFPVTEKQYEAIKEHQERTGSVTEEEIMQIVNAVEYKQDDWNPWFWRRTVCGVGYYGMTMNAKEYSSVVYVTWQNMIQRCYSKKIQKKYKPQYKDKSVCEEWHNYANFKLWYEKHITEGCQIDLDKDLLKQGNKIYSPETCLLIEHYINITFEGRGDGVYQTKDGKYTYTKRKDVVFDTEEGALQEYYKDQQKLIDNMAEKHKSKIPNCAYEAMLRWNVAV